MWQEILKKKQDACYHKVKSRYKKWPSAYASGALVQCRRKDASKGTKQRCRPTCSACKTYKRRKGA